MFLFFFSNFQWNWGGTEPGRGESEENWTSYFKQTHFTALLFYGMTIDFRLQWQDWTTALTICSCISLKNFIFLKKKDSDSSQSLNFLWNGEAGSEPGGSWCISRAAQCRVFNVHLSQSWCPCLPWAKLLEQDAPWPQERFYGPTTVPWCSVPVGSQGCGGLWRVFPWFWITPLSKSCTGGCMPPPPKADKIIPWTLDVAAWTCW